MLSREINRIAELEKIKDFLNFADEYQKYKKES